MVNKKILNPKTGRYVNYNGILGKKIRKEMKGGSSEYPGNSLSGRGIPYQRTDLNLNSVSCCGQKGGASEEKKKQYRKKTEEIVKKHMERGRKWAAIQQKAEYCKNIKFLTNRHKKNIKDGKCGMDCIEEIKDLLEDTEKNCKSQLKKVKALLPKTKKKKSKKKKQKGGNANYPDSFKTPNGRWLSHPFDANALKKTGGGRKKSARKNKQKAGRKKKSARKNKQKAGQPNPCGNSSRALKCVRVCQKNPNGGSTPNGEKCTKTCCNSLVKTGGGTRKNKNKKNKKLKGGYNYEYPGKELTGKGWPYERTDFPYKVGINLDEKYLF